MLRGTIQSRRGTRCLSRAKYTTYAFIGLGKMGAPMATNLRKNMGAEDHLLLYDTNKASLRSLLDIKGTKEASGLKEIAQSADVIVTMLPDSSHVEECYFGETGFCFDEPPITSTLKSDTSAGKMRWMIDCSTIDPLRSRSISKRIARLGNATFIDAPVSGGVKGAEAATLSFMVGHQPHDEISRILEMMGRTIHFCGEAGSGLSAKLSNNYLLAINNLATAEAMRLGISLGLQPDVLGKVINSSTGKCWPSEKNNPVLGVTPGAPVERGYDGGFGIELMMKDLGLALGAAKGVGVNLALSSPVKQVYETVQRARDGKYKGKDFGVVYQYLEDHAAGQGNVSN